MQPETKVKENGQVSKYTAKVQWDHLCFTVIEKELAPNGYRKEDGRTEVSAIRYLSKDSVVKTQKIAAQLVRGFRDKVKQRIEAIQKDFDQWIAEDDDKLKSCRFWELGKKRDLKDKLISLRGQAGSFHRLLQELENIGIK